MKPNYQDHKTALTPAEKLRVAVAVLVDGFDQHKVAALMGVNPGRVAEAVVAVRNAIEPGESKELVFTAADIPVERSGND